MPPRTLIIGYGNELRRDDGIGPFVARTVAALKLPGVIALAVHQLTPELAAELSCVDRAIFVDASIIGKSVHVKKVAPVHPDRPTAHSGDPARLLGLSRHVYGRCPVAWMITVPAHDLDFGEGFSIEGQCGAEAAIGEIRRLLG